MRPLGQAADPGERGGGGLRAKYYTPDMTKVEFHWKMPLKIHWDIPGKIHWKSVNPLGNTTEKCKSVGKCL